MRGTLVLVCAAVIAAAAIVCGHPAAAAAPLPPAAAEDRENLMEYNTAAPPQGWVDGRGRPHYVLPPKDDDEEWLRSEEYQEHKELLRVNEHYARAHGAVGGRSADAEASQDAASAAPVRRLDDYADVEPFMLDWPRHGDVDIDIKPLSFDDVAVPPGPLDGASVKRELCIAKLLESQLDETAFDTAAKNCLELRDDDDDVFVGATPDDTLNTTIVEAVASIEAAEPAEPVDTDGDGVPDYMDNCPFVINNAQLDPDSDGFGTVCDNCPHAVNMDQKDSDGNGVGDACEETLQTTTLADTVTLFYYAAVGLLIAYDVAREKYTSAAWSLVLLNAALLIIGLTIGVPTHWSMHLLDVARMVALGCVLAVRSLRRSKLDAPRWTWSDVVLDAYRILVVFDALDNRPYGLRGAAIPYINEPLLRYGMAMLAAASVAGDVFALGRGARRWVAGEKRD